MSCGTPGKDFLVCQPFVVQSLGFCAARSAGPQKSCVAVIVQMIART